jgi:hypothetical protein
MKRILTITAALALLAAGASAQDKNIVKQTDKFTGKTTVSMKMFGVGPLFGFQDATQSSISGASVILALGAITGDSGKPGLLIYVTASHWQFLGGTDVHVLADGQPIDLGHFVALKSHVESVGSVTTNEIVVRSVDRSVLDRMANAKDLQMKVGPYEFKINPKNVERLKEFSAALPAVAKSEVPTQDPK